MGRKSPPQQTERKKDNKQAKRQINKHKRTARRKPMNTSRVADTA